jgi:hypothetical protein
VRVSCELDESVGVKNVSITSVFLFSYTDTKETGRQLVAMRENGLSLSMASLYSGKVLVAFLKLTQLHIRSMSVSSVVFTVFCIFHI